jgi:hypothetical protein
MVAAGCKNSQEICSEDIFIFVLNLGSFERNCFEGLISEVMDREPVIYVMISVPLDFICLINIKTFQVSIYNSSTLKILSITPILFQNFDKK